MDLAIHGAHADSGRLIYLGAVAGGLAMLRPRRGGTLPPRWGWRDHLALAVGSWVPVAVAEVGESGWLATATPGLSLVTIPWVSVVVYPALLLASATGAWRFFAPVFSITEQALVWLVRVVLSAPFQWQVAPRSVGAGLALAALALGFGRRFNPRRGFRVAWSVGGILLGARAAGAFTVPLPTFDGRATEVRQLDVGQGDAALIRAPGFFGLIDAGSQHRVSDLSWLSLLGRRGATRVDWIALTHLDEDHAGGVRRLARLVPIGCVAAAEAELASDRGQRFVDDLRSRGVAVRGLAERCVPFPAFDPRAAGVPRHQANANMAAYFVPLESGGFYFSAGDADRSAEVPIGRWERDREFEAALKPGPRVLKISHHGSHTSSAPEFLARLNPTEAWISVGTGNPYGHPHPDVLALLAARGIPIRRTDRDGTLRAGGGRRPR